LTYLKTGVVNVHWTYAQGTKIQSPFEVPLEIVNANKADISSNPLSDVVTKSFAADGTLQLNILNGKGGSIFYTLNGMLLGQYFNFIDGTIRARKDPGFQGVMGLTEQVSKNLFLPTGVYSLWSRDIPDPVETGTPPGSNMYGTHPMLMG
jgi:hypothetical protein